MKKANKVAFRIFLMMLIPLYIFTMSSAFYAPFTKHENLADYQIKQITSKLEFELLPHESLYVVFFPGMMQASKALFVHIENIESETSFRSRLQSDLEIFQFEGRPPKDFRYELLFCDEGENLKATFEIVGHIPELSTIYDFFHKPRHLLDSLAMRIVLVIQFALIIFLVGNKIIRPLYSKTQN